MHHKSINRDEEKRRMAAYEEARRSGGKASDAAEKCGVPRSTYTAWMRRRGLPPIERVASKPRRANARSAAYFLRNAETGLHTLMDHVSGSFAVSVLERVILDLAEARGFIDPTHYETELYPTGNAGAAEE